MVRTKLWQIWIHWISFYPMSWQGARRKKWKPWRTSTIVTMVWKEGPGLVKLPSNDYKQAQYCCIDLRTQIVHKEIVCHYPRSYISSASLHCHMFLIAASNRLISSFLLPHCLILSTNDNHPHVLPLLFKQKTNPLHFWALLSFSLLPAHCPSFLFSFLSFFTAPIAALPPHTGSQGSVPWSLPSLSCWTNKARHHLW